MAIIEINAITKDYGNNKGVFDVSFQLNKGEVVGFLGPNGAGKTTTIRQLMGFIKPDKGSVTIFDYDCFKDAAKVQEQLGYLPGEIAFMDEMSGMDFIRFVAAMKNLKDETRMKELIARFELDPHGKIKKMSKGMKQKIGIVCAFMQDSDILILDEPTSGLDPLMQNVFVELIQEEKEKGKTILMSSHMFEEIERTCDRAIIIKNGKIVADKMMEELRQEKHRVFEIRFQSNEDAKMFIKEYPESKVNHNEVILDLNNDVDQFIKALSKYSIADFNMRSQTIEELFMHFYGGDHYE